MHDGSWWLIIEPYVQMTFQGNEVLFYNTLNKKMLFISDSPIISRLCHLLSKQSSDYVIKLPEEERAKPEIQIFIKELRKNYMGDLLKQSWSAKKPVIIMPNPLIKKQNTSNFIPPNELLVELTLHLSSGNSGLVRQYSKAYSQFIFPQFVYGKRKELDLKLLQSIFAEIRSYSKMNLSLVSDNISIYTNLEELLSLLEAVNHRKRFYFFPAYFDSRLWEKPPNNSNYIFLLTHPFHETKIHQINESLQQLKTHIPIEWHFIVQDSHELVEANGIIQNLNLTGSFFKPYFNRSNYFFFRDYVFITREDIQASRPDQQQIFARKMINETEWGKLTIHPGGKVFANVNDEPLGNLKKDTMNDLTKHEQENGISWKRIRSSVSPCKNCIYHLLCPPISNYELVMKRFNLCHIIQ